MADEYTPTTDAVRSRYIYWASEPLDAFNGELQAREAEFDRWLANERANAVRDFALHTLPTEWCQRALEHAGNIRKGEKRG